MIRNKFIIALLMASIPFFSFAQDIEVKKFELLEKDQTAALSPRKDINGADCALVLVRSLKKGLEFEGWVVGDVEYKNDSYLVYMANGSKNLKIKHPDYQTKTVVFGDYGIGSLKGGQMYKLSVVDETKDIINKVYSLGWNLNGYQVDDNVKRIFSTAATRGDTKAQIAMAQLATVKNGDLDQNERAFLWVEKILLKGDSSCLDVMPGELMGVFAKRQKAQIWRGSSRVEKDIEKALYNKACKYELKACLKGYKKAGDELFADFIQSGGLPSDCDQFMSICQDSANYNNVKAMRCLGIIYEKGICTNQDLSASLILYQKIDKLSPSTQSKTDLCRVLGNKDFPVDLEGIEYIKQKANENLPEAIFQIGLMYEEGRHFPKDINKALEYYSKIAPVQYSRDRHPGAAFRMAVICYEQKDYKKASSFLIGLDDDDALYLGAIIDYSQYNYTDNRVRVFNILSNLSKKGYQKATNFIKNHY